MQCVMIGSKSEVFEKDYSWVVISPHEHEPMIACIYAKRPYKEVSVVRKSVYCRR